MLGVEIENKIKGITVFLTELFVVLFSFILPKFFVKALRRKSEGASGPFTFLTINAFFGLKLWTFIFITYLVYNTPSYEQRSYVQTESTTPDKLSVLDYVGIPALDELIFLTIPYIVIAVCIAWLFERRCKKKKWDLEISPRDLMLYFAGFLILAIPLILIVDLGWIEGTSNQKDELNKSTGSFDLFWFRLVILLSLPFHLLQTLKLASGKFWNAKKYLRGFLVWSFVLPLTVFGAMISTLFVSNKILDSSERILSNKTVDNYLSSDLFKARIVDTLHSDDAFYWKVIIKGNDTKNDKYEVLDKKGYIIFNELGDTICNIKTVKGKKDFDSHDPGILDITSDFPQVTQSDYLFIRLSVFNKTEFDVPSPNILLWSTGKKELLSANRTGWIENVIYDIFCAENKRTMIDSSNILD